MSETYDDYRRRRGCEGKSRYLTRKEAKDWFRKLQIPNKDPMKAYNCEFCGMWHLGHTEGATGIRISMRDRNK